MLRKHIQRNAFAATTLLKSLRKLVDISAARRFSSCNNIGMQLLQIITYTTIDITPFVIFTAAYICFTSIL